MRIRNPFVLPLLLLALAPARMAGAVPATFEARMAAFSRTAGKTPESRRLHELFALSWANTMEENPEQATEVGYPGQNHRWTDLSPEAIARRKRDALALRQAIRSLRRERLGAVDQLHFDLFRRNNDEAIESARFPGELLAVTQLEGVQTLSNTLEAMPQARVKDYEDRLARLKALPVLIGQSIELLKRGLARKITPPRIILRDLPGQLDSLTADDLEGNPLLGSFRKMPADFPDKTKNALSAEARATLSLTVVPAYRRLKDFLVREYLPGCRVETGMDALPEGKEWYAFKARTSTTTALTPAAIHELGLSEVKRIRARMQALLEQTKFKGSLPDFFSFLRTDARFYFEKPEDLLLAYRNIAKRIDPELPRLFGKLPRLPYGVRPIPGFSEKSQTTAYYEVGSAESGRPGYFAVNLYNPAARPKWEMEALTLHEAVPGHHLQIALAQEQGDLPEFRKHGFYTAFTEGWALYAEGLGTEIGIFSDDYSRFGQLTYEMWRAVRLVVDTGLHAMGWSREKAIAYFQENAPKTEHDITVEIDRYLAMPGQALAYKIGELKIQELRALSRKKLGARFDVRRFHDALLENGALPLQELESHILAWVKAQG